MTRWGRLRTGAKTFRQNHKVELAPALSGDLGSGGWRERRRVWRGLGEFIEDHPAFHRLLVECVQWGVREETLGSLLDVWDGVDTRPGRNMDSRLMHDNGRAALHLSRQNKGGRNLVCSFHWALIRARWRV